jgi:hypothetical protein
LNAFTHVHKNKCNASKSQKLHHPNVLHDKRKDAITRQKYLHMRVVVIGSEGVIAGKHVLLLLLLLLLLPTFLRRKHAAKISDANGSS